MGQTREHVYRVTEVVRVTDGDTYWLRVDVGFRQTNLINVRLLGYDTPEVNVKDDRERTAGIAAKGAAEVWWLKAFGEHRDEGGVVFIRTEKDPDSFGRWLGEVWIEYPDGQAQNLGTLLEAKDLASKWPTRWRDQYLA